MLPLLVLLLVGMASSASSQTPQQEFEAWKQRTRAEFADYKKQVRKDYDEFRKKTNAEYAQLMQEAWRSVKGHAAETPPAEPKPPRQPIDVPDKLPPAEPLPSSEVVPMPAPVPVPEIPLPDVEDENIPTISFLFYHTPCVVHWEKSQKYRLSDLRESAISEAWRQLSEGSYDLLLHDCLQMKQALQLGDWGFIDLVRQTSIELFINECSEAVLLQQWLLTQAGYKVRIARGERRLMLLVPFDIDVYNYRYVELDDGRYYALGGNDDENIYIFDQSFDGEHEASLRMQQPPLLSIYTTSRRTIASIQYPMVSIKATTNQNLIDFYEHYPRVAGNWDIYANTSLSDDVKQQIYPRLREKLAGNSAREQVSMLLNLVQTGLSYATDQEQFGCERSLFADESLFYPSCDCEDRSILFSIMVRDLIGLDVVLLQSPGHLFTAVRLDDAAEGHYIDIDGHRYTVCDPTYIGAPVGLAMPESVQSGIKVFRIGE